MEKTMANTLIASKVAVTPPLTGDGTAASPLTYTGSGSDGTKYYTIHFPQDSWSIEYRYSSQGSDGSMTPHINYNKVTLGAFNIKLQKKDRTVTFIENAKVNIPNEIYGGNSTNAISSRSYHKIEVVLDDSIKPDSQQTNLVSGNFGDFESQFKFSILSDRMSLSIMTNGQDGDSSFTLKLSGKTYLAKE